MVRAQDLQWIGDGLAGLIAWHLKVLSVQPNSFDLATSLLDWDNWDTAGQLYCPSKYGKLILLLAHLDHAIEQIVYIFFANKWINDIYHKHG